MQCETCESPFTACVYIIIQNRRHADVILDHIAKRRNTYRTIIQLQSPKFYFSSSVWQVIQVYGILIRVRRLSRYQLTGSSVVSGAIMIAISNRRGVEMGGTGSRLSLQENEGRTTNAAEKLAARRTHEHYVGTVRKRLI